MAISSYAVPILIRKVLLTLSCETSVLMSLKKSCRMLLMFITGINS